MVNVITLTTMVTTSSRAINILKRMGIYKC